MTRSAPGNSLEPRFGPLFNGSSFRHHDEAVIGDMDVSGALVNASFRSTPWAAEEAETASGRTAANILFVSESNVCRSVLAQAIMQQLLDEAGLAHCVHCESKGTRDYNLGDGPEPAVVRVAQEQGIRLPDGFAARQMDHEADIVQFDLVLVMDKYTAADVLREVSVYDTINKGGNYSLKVRRLGEFHPGLQGSTDPDGQDINDPLYGNVGGEEEQIAVTRAVLDIRAACEGCLRFLQQVQRNAGSEDSFRISLKEAVNGMKTLEWLVPPMLQQR
ncbi:hypothetical protein WJX72_002020 [[Myrmecia] bisecta]|uniref:protein-tyrosine-phosphatase n=1 Tax=[Myrmecia] bisecta TaxID=41462 RepID=A0AAW1Q3Y7_9CHLO